METDEELGPSRLLAEELRRLRRAAGWSQRHMATALGLSAHSAVADYENAKRLPPNDILLAYQQLFGTSTPVLNQLRADALAERADRVGRSPRPRLDQPLPVGRTDSSNAVDPAPVNDSSTAPASADPPAPVPPRSPDGPAPATSSYALTESTAPDARVARRRRDLGRLGMAAVIVTLSAAVLGGSSTGTPRQMGSTPLASGWYAVTQNNNVSSGSDVMAEDMDGDDPRARGCADAYTVDSVPMYLLDATVFGTLRLRHSPRCGTSWASAYYGNPHLYTVTLVVRRPADSAEIRFDWSNNTPPGSYSDMLSTARGCVEAEAIIVTPAGRSHPVRTRCVS